ACCSLDVTSSSECLFLFIETPPFGESRYAAFICTDGAQPIGRGRVPRLTDRAAHCIRSGRSERIQTNTAICNLIQRVVGNNRRHLNSKSSLDVLQPACRNSRS